MEEGLFTFFMLAMTIVLIIVRYILPLVMVFTGVYLIMRNKRKNGYILVGLGIALGLVSLLVKILLQ